MIVESIVTSVSESGEINCAPMGVEWGDDRIVLKPFLETATYRNVTATRTAVINLVDDVGIFARAAISNPSYATVPAVAVTGAVLADCCSWRARREWLEPLQLRHVPQRAQVPDWYALHRRLRTASCSRAKVP